MRRIKTFRDTIRAEGFTAVALSGLYALLGIGFLFVSPTVGAVLLTVGIATFGLFRLLERLTHRGR